MRFWGEDRRWKWEGEGKREEKNERAACVNLCRLCIFCTPAPISPQCFLSTDGGTELKTAGWKVLSAPWSRSTEHSVTDLHYSGIKLLVHVSLLLSTLEIPQNKDHPTVLCYLPKLLIVNLRAKRLKGRNISRV